MFYLFTCYTNFVGSELIFAILKGVVCQLNEGDEFGKLALVNNALR